VTSALNPKIALFYGSVFASALPAQPGLMHVIAAVILVYVNSWVWHGSLAFGLSQPKVQRSYMRNYQLLTRCSAVLVAGFGARLLVIAIQEARTQAT
jgi:threonine efflux protein